MNVNINVGLKARYRLHTEKRGKVTKSTGWFDNLITDAGLNNIGLYNYWPMYCSVGSSSATPRFTDTQLGSRIASIGSSDGRYGGFRVDSANRYAVFRWTYTFPAGTATGNIAEVGVGPQPNGLNISSRARILDSGGVPTTITVLSDEDLVVVWELFVKQPTGDFTNSLDGGRTATTRAANVDAVGGTGAWSSRIYASFTDGTARAFTGGIVGITGEPTGPAGVAVTITSVAQPYTPGNHYRNMPLTWATNQANGAAVRSIQWVFGPTSWQTEFDPVIPAKNNTQTLKVTVRVSWSRDSGPA